MKLSIQDFAELCNCTPAIIRTNINRKKLSQDRNKMIDTDAVKSIFFKKRRYSLDMKRGKVPDTNKKVDSTIAAYKNRKTIADAKKAGYEASLRKIKLEQAMGKVIPLETMERILKHNIREIFIRYEQSLLNLASVQNDIMGGNRKTLGELNDGVRVELERQIKLASDDVEKNVNKAIESYKE